MILETDETISPEIRDGVIEKMMRESTIDRKTANRIFEQQFVRDSFDPPKQGKRYRSTSHCPDAACMANTRAEAEAFFRGILKVDKLPKNFRMIRY
jgi:hypothetical protein